MSCTNETVSPRSSEDLPSASTKKRKLSVSDELVKNILKHSKKDSQVEDTNDRYEETSYYFENGLRKVYPYYFTYSTFCKGRWVGKKLLDVFSREFRAFTEPQYKQSILTGSLRVNGLQVIPDYVLKDNDRITNSIHRHEVAVLATPIKILHLSDELVVIDKPPSVPVHPCGRYRYNSLLFILAKEHGLKALHTIHRLDRLTSGVMLFTKTLKKSQELDELIRQHKIEKEYLCRVEGRFPDSIVTCKEPVEILSPKIGVCRVKSSGKECATDFERVSYNGKSSVVRCKPHTGRMHQIRVHLQYLGYPIVNDPIYNHKDAFGPMKGKGGETGKSDEELLNDLMEIHNIDKWLKVDEAEIEIPSGDNGTEESVLNNKLLKLLNHNSRTEDYNKLEENYKKDLEKIVTDSECNLCNHKYKDPEPKDLILFLHAVCYKSDTWEFKTEVPVWAKDNWTDL